MIRRFSPFALALMLATAATAEDSIVEEFNSSSLQHSVGYDAELRQILFRRLSGLSHDDAVDALKSEGFRCTPTDCLLIVTDKETAGEIWSRKIPSQGKVLGKRHTTRALFQVALTADPIRRATDIFADFRYETGFVPWYRRPKDSDFTVHHD